MKQIKRDFRALLNSAGLKEIKFRLGKADIMFENPGLSGLLGLEIFIPREGTLDYQIRLISPQTKLWEKYPFRIHMLHTNRDF